MRESGSLVRQPTPCVKQALGENTGQTTDYGEIAPYQLWKLGNDG
jgi:hypothetical protein